MQATGQARQSPATFGFGAFEVDLAAGELRKHGVRVKLQQQPFQVLQCLLERPREVVTREELRQRIWPADTFVDFDHGLYNAIKRLREALADSAEEPRFIETLARRGYRFIGSVNETSRSPNPQSKEFSAVEKATETSQLSGKWRRSLLSLMSVSALLAALFAFNAAGIRDRVLPQRGASKIQSLAVLPLTNLSGDPAQEYFADGMTDALTTDLSQISALKVISRTSAMRYKKTDKSLPQIGRELGVDAVVEGTVQRSGDRVRITAQLIQADKDKHIWARSYDRRVEDVLALQGDIARTIAQEISVEVKPEERLRVAHPRPINLEAVEAFLQGRYHYQNALDMAAHRGAEKAREPEFKLAISYFQRAVAADPNYAPAYVGMGEVWGVPATFPYPSRSQEQPAKEALRKALAIDPTLAQAHVDLGRIEFREWNWSAAEQEFKRAIELNPNLASARIQYSNYLNAMGRLDESMEQAQRAKALEPGNDQVAWQFYCRHEFDRFIEMKRGDIARHAYGSMAHFDLGHGYERAHMYKEAVEEWETATANWGYDDLAKDLRQGYRVSGFRGAIREWTAGLETLSKQGELIHPDLMAYLYAILGEKDRAFAWLEKSMEMHSSGPLYFKVDPDVDDLRSDPRFADLLRRVGLQ
jgi:TolB-like protein/DNA-binding winged helix-turn-helix (wHTH) protein